MNNDTEVTINSDLQSKVYAEQVRMLYDAMPASTLANIITSMLFVMAQWTVIDHRILAWWFFISLVIILSRNILLISYKRAAPGVGEMKAWGYRFNLGSSSTALVLGAAGVFLFPANEPVHQIMCAFVLVGMSSGAVSSLSFGKFNFPIYLSFVLTPLLVSLAIEGSRLTLIVIFMVLLAFAFTLRSARYIYKNTSQNIILRLEALKREPELVELKNMLQVVLNNIPSRVYWKDKDNRYLGCNKSFANDARLASPDDIHGKTDFDLPWEKSASLYRDDDQLIMTSGQPRLSFEETQTTSSGKIIWRELSKIPLIKPDGTVYGILGTYQDITERKQTEFNILAAKNDAVKANLAKSDFLSNMSHELRTPMNAILGFGQLLQLENSYLTDDQNESVDHIVEAGNHLLVLINEMLDLSSIEAGKIDLSIEAVSLSQIINNSVSLLKPIAKTHKVILPELLTEDFYVHADEKRLKQIILNLLSNAIKYNREGGSVDISIKPVEDDYLHISLSDTGVGIKREYQSHIFDSFSRVSDTKDATEGTGIGLTITKALVESMDGRIGFDSEYGKGSTFWFELPQASAVDVEISLTDSP